MVPVFLLFEIRVRMEYIVYLQLIEQSKQIIVDRVLAQPTSQVKPQLLANVLQVHQLVGQAQAQSHKSKCPCGKQTLKRIVGGTSAHVGDFPWQTGIRYNSFNEAELKHNKLQCHCTLFSAIKLRYLRL